MRALALLVLLSIPAAASSQSELVACFDELTPYSSGFGYEIGQWEWAPPVHYPTVVVPGDRAGVEGFFVYTEDRVLYADFQKVPRDQRNGWMRWFPIKFGPVREGRGVFQCSYLAQNGVQDRKIDCDFGDFLGDSVPPKGKLAPTPPQKYYHPIGFKEIGSSDVNLGSLRGAVLSRIMSVTHGYYAKQAEKYGKALEAHKKRMNDGPSALSQAAGFMGMDLDWNRNPPTRPSKDPAARALRTCASMQMNDQLADAARTELRMLDNYSLPR